MQIEGTYKIKAPREVVFGAMLDPEHLSKAVPGCQKLIHLGDNKYEMIITIGVAAVKGTYEGKIQLDDIVVPEAYKMIVEGSAFPGAIKGIVSIRVTDDESSTNTNVFYSGDIEVYGKIAAVGTRFLGMTAKMLIGKFFKAMSKELGKATG
jgi:carbon monoxide dehydrogenase subunit G